MAVHEAQLVGYESAHERAVYFPILGADCLRLEGPDRVDFLQRQTTNDTRLLSETHSVRTILTSPTARIIDVLSLVGREDGIDILTLPGRGKSTAQFLNAHIFFMDKVTVADQSHSISQFDLGGSLLMKVLTEAKIDVPERDGVIHSEVSGVGVTLIGCEGLFGLPGVRVLGASTDFERLQGALDRSGFTQLSAEAHEVLRVESGLPGSVELSEDYTPLEVNLFDAISDAKGCYTGQEIIARQITYDKITRRLIGLSVKEPVEVGWRVEADRRTVGEVTSSVESPRHGSIALAVIKRPHDQASTCVTVSAEHRQVDAIVTQLPFE